MIREIAAADIPTYLDSRHQSAHNKIIVIDAGNEEAAAVTAVFNFTYTAQFKSTDNQNIFRGNPQIATAYREN
jgi:hypothetical protein